MTRPSNDTRFYMRNLKRVVISGSDRMLFAGGKGGALTLRSEVVSQWSALLQALVAPIQLSELASAAALPDDFSHDFFNQLVETDHIASAHDPQALLDARQLSLTEAPAFHFEGDALACRHLLVGCSGSVVAGLMAQTLLSLRFCGFQEQLDVLLTTTASRFLSRDLLEAYGIRCWQDSFERQDGIRVPHVNLASTAELICVLPATADALNRIAHSACSDLLSLTITSSQAPVLLVPVMNAAMWNNAGVQRNVDQLRKDGRYILEPSIIFGAAEFDRNAPPMYGGHGCLWSGPQGLIAALSAVGAQHTTT